MNRKKCAHCGGSMKGKRLDAEVCSDSCRVGRARKRKLAGGGLVEAAKKTAASEPEKMVCAGMGFSLSPVENEISVPGPEVKWTGLNIPKAEEGKSILAKRWVFPNPPRRRFPIPLTAIERQILHRLEHPQYVTTGRL